MNNIVNKELNKITCNGSSDDIRGAFLSASRALKMNEKNFKILHLTLTSDEKTLESNIFSDITFETFKGEKIMMIKNGAFSNQNKRLHAFDCSECAINSYSNINGLFYPMTNLLSLKIQLDVLEIPTNFFVSPPNEKSMIENISIALLKRTSIASGAFKNLYYLSDISFSNTLFVRIKSGAFQNLDYLSGISFRNIELVIEKDAFVLSNSQNITFKFEEMLMNYLSKEAFGKVLNNRNSTVQFVNSKIDCWDCNNYWMIEQKLQNQVLNASCIDDDGKTLFDHTIKDRLVKKCLHL